MIYTIIKDNVSYDLPPFTISVSEAMDKINAQNCNPSANKKTCYQGMIDFIVSEVGKENAEAILGCTDVAKVDLQEVHMCYLEIAKAYEKPLSDMREEEMREKLDNAELDKVLEFMKNIGNIDKLQNAATKQQGKANLLNAQR